MKKLLIYLSLIISTHCFSQTCIVAIKENKQIMVGADSRVSRGVLDLMTGAQHQIFSDTSCKIISNGTGDINFSISGFDGIGIRNLAHSIMDTCKNIHEFQKIFKKAASNYVFKRISTMSQIEYGNVDTVIKMQYSVIDAIIFGRYKDSLILNYISMRRVITSPDDFSVGWIGKDNIDSVAIGEYKEIYENRLFSNKEVWKKGLQSGVQYLINFSHKYHPDHVGGPTNFVLVTKRKTIWLDRKAPCN